MDALPIESDSDCPSPVAVQAEVRDLTTPEQRAGVPAGSRVVVSDRDGSIAVAITRDGKTTIRVYQDAARDCARRSHFVSVLVVVSLMPPDVSAPPEPEPEPALPPAPAEPEPEPPEPPKRVRLELSARGEVGTPLADTVRISSVGGALGVALGAGRVRLTLATGYMPSAALRFTGAWPGRAELERLDVAAGLRLMLTHSPLATSLDVSAVATRSEVNGLTSHAPTQDTAFSLGARAGLRFGWSDQRLLSPFLGVQASLFPAAPALFQLPQGTVGHLPYVWLGLSGGLALAL